MEKLCSSFLSIVLFNILLVAQQLPPASPACRYDERSALLELKRGFTGPVDPSYAANYISYVTFDPLKLDSWGKGDCCTWDGVECEDADNGSVIGIDLSCTGLHATLNSTGGGGIFRRLPRLRDLNLAYNNFDGSPMPSAAISDLPAGLKSLNFSGCEMSGQIPQSVLGLINLTSLDLSSNNGLKLVTPGFGDLARTLLKLEQLDLSKVDISSSPVPESVLNLSSLTSLTLEDCGLRGRIPPSMFGMRSLQLLDMSINSLSGNLPEFNRSSPLRSLYLGRNNLSGELSASIGNLVFLDLSWNRLEGGIPSFTNATRLSGLYLRYNSFTGGISSSIDSLPGLEQLVLNDNQLTGPIPLRILNLTGLVYVDLSMNMFDGTLPIDEFLGLPNLEVLLLAFNNLSAVYNPNGKMSTVRHPSRLRALNLASCGLHEIPRLLLNLQQLTLLDLSSNKIAGPVPVWFGNVSQQTLMFLNLSSNSLTGFEGRNPVQLNWANLTYLELNFNELQGPLPLPPASILTYRATDNRLSGDIPASICDRRFIQVLDLAKNNLSGTIPACFGSLTGTLTTLNLHHNSLTGLIPEPPDTICTLKMLDLNHNRLHGPLPRSLSSCTSLEFLNVGNNNIDDTFPSWLDGIAGLRLLILQSNRFNGAIEGPKTDSGFQSLQIIDVSKNNFQGALPAKYFESWEPMKISTTEGSEYFGGDGNSPTALGYIGYSYDFTLTITNKGMQMEYAAILAYFEAADFSSNNFSGEIPETIADLRGLRLLNLSDNDLSGHIPSFLGGLTNLEALDLSGNRFSGEIPQQLTKLSFLSFFNVSGNRLSGPIPRGTQFDTFKNSSYGGNEGLCGLPLSSVCDALAGSPGELQDKDEESSLKIEWKALAVGYASGLAIAAVIGHKIITPGTVKWFSGIFGVGKR